MFCLNTVTDFSEKYLERKWKFNAGEPSQNRYHGISKTNDMEVVKATLQTLHSSANVGILITLKTSCKEKRRI